MNPKRPGTIGVEATGHPSKRIRPELWDDMTIPTTRCTWCSKLKSDTTAHP